MGCSLTLIRFCILWEVSLLFLLNFTFINIYFVSNQKMISRILLNLHPLDKVEAVLLFEVKAKV